MTSSVMTRMPRACAAAMKRRDVRQRAVVRMHVAVVGDVIAVIAAAARDKTAAARSR